MPKKIFSLVFVLSLVVAPLATHAGFFDLFRFDRGYQNSAQVKMSDTMTMGLKRGDKSEVVLQVQQVLTAAKLYAGDLSGLIGPKTEAAIKAWQVSHGLAVTGILDTATINSILARGESDDDRGGGGNADDIDPAPSLSYLQGRCNTNNGTTSGRWSRVLTPWTGDEILHPNDFQIQAVVCDIIDPANPRTLVVFASNEGQLQTQIYRSDTSAELQQMELVIDDSYAPLKIYNITMNTAQFPFPIGFHTMKSSLYHPDDNDLVEQTWVAPGAFEIVEEVGGGNCLNATALDSYGRTINAGLGEQTVAKYEFHNNCEHQISLDKLTFSLVAFKGQGLIVQADLFKNVVGNLTPISQTLDFAHTVTPAGEENIRTFVISTTGDGTSVVTLQPGASTIVEMHAKTQAEPQATIYAEPTVFVIGLNDLDYMDLVTQTSQEWTQVNPVWGERTIINPI